MYIAGRSPSGLVVANFCITCWDVRLSLGPQAALAALEISLTAMSDRTRFAVVSMFSRVPGSDARRCPI